MIITKIMSLIYHNKQKKSILVNCYAKINLSLEITSKLKNDYHSLKSIFGTIELHDVIKVEFSKNPELRIYGKYAKGVPADNKNIVFKTIEALKNYLNLQIFQNLKNSQLSRSFQTLKTPQTLINLETLLSSLKISIEKNIPPKAGLGGASANAAGLLVALNNLLNLKLSKNQLSEIGKSIGADVPFCLNFGGVALVSGLGDKIKNIPCSNSYNLCIVVNQKGVSTQKAYKLFDEIAQVNKNSILANKQKAHNELINSLKKENRKTNNQTNQFPPAFFNDLQEPAFLLNSELKNNFNIIQKIVGYKNACLTGSGSAIIIYNFNKKTLVELKAVFGEKNLIRTVSRFKKNKKISHL